MLANLLPSGSRQRTAAFLLAGTAAILVLTQVLLPGSGGNGTPWAKIFEGVVYGLLTSLVSAGIILIYRTTRIINFSQAALGAAGGIFTYSLGVLLGWPFFLSFPAGVIVSAMLGFVVELAFIRRFFDAPRLVLTVLTIALIGFLQFATGFVGALPIFGDVRDRDLDELLNTPLPIPFPNFRFQIGSFPLEFGFAHFFALGISVIALFGLGYFFRFTRSGVAVRAASENSDRALLLGINVKGLSTLVWTLAAVLSGIGIISGIAVTGGAGTGDFAPTTLLYALAAAVIAKMRSLPIAVAASVGITVIREAVLHSYEGQGELVDASLFVLVLIALLSQRKRAQRSEASDTSSWRATEEHRPIPKELLAVTGVKVWRWVLIIVGLIAVAMLPWISPTGTINRAGFVAILAIVVLSLVVLTGWAGQVSLGQFAFVAVGAVVGGALTSRVGISFWLAVPLASTFTAGFAMLVGLPALRIKGLFLGITTFSFAFAIQAALFKEEYFGWLLPDRVDRPTLFLLDFEDERSMYYLSVFALVLAILLVSTLRRSRPGRILIGLRDNENNVQSFGINVIRTKLAAFGLSGFLCGYAGVLLAHHQRAATEASFQVTESIDVFLYGVVGGIGSVSGAMLGAGYYALSTLLASNRIVQFFAGSTGIIFILYMSPGGLASVAFGLRDSILRIVAQRRQMVVPSLFADIDPESLEMQLIPLGEPLPDSGLAALPFSQRYKLESRIHGKRRMLLESGRSPVREAAAIGAAAESLEALAEAKDMPVGSAAEGA